MSPKFPSDNSHYPNQIPLKMAFNESLSLEKVGEIPSDKDFLILLRRYFDEEVMGLSPLSIKAKREDLGKFLLFFNRMNGHLRVEEWLPRDTKAFVDELIKKSYKASTINRTLASVRTFGKWLHGNGIINHDPCRKIRELQLPAPEPKRVTELDFHRIMKTVEVFISAPKSKLDQSFRNKTMMVLLYNTGLRINEILNLKVIQLQVVGKKLVHVYCKGNKVRDVKISKECVELIEEYVSNYRICGSEYLFTSRHGEKISRNGIAQALHLIARMASINLPDGEELLVTPHRFRHSVGYRARELKGDVWAAERLGHTSLNFVGRYGTTSDSDNESLVDKL